MPSRTPPLVLLFLVCYSPVCLAWTWAPHFQDWYPEYGFIFNRILHENCNDEYANYINGTRNWTELYETYRWTGASRTSIMAQPVAACLLENVSEYIKANMASAAVLLGLTPAILALIGSSIEESSALFVIARRPLLGLCLAVGSPSVNPMRAFKYYDPLRLLEDRSGRKEPPHIKKILKNLTGFLEGYIGDSKRPSKAFQQRLCTLIEYSILLGEYLFAWAAIANMITLGIQLGERTTCTYAPQLTYLPLVWGLMGAFAHLFGASALRLRVRRDRKIPLKYERDGKQMVLNGPAAVRDWLYVQITPWAWHKPFHIKVVKETYWYVLVSWVTSTYITCHVIFGTLTFSSMIFISVRDSVLVLSRFMASAIVCRVILMYELAVLRDRVIDKSDAGSELAKERLGSVVGGSAEDTSPTAERSYKLPTNHIRADSGFGIGPRQNSGLSQYFRVDSVGDGPGEEMEMSQGRLTDSPRPQYHVRGDSSTSIGLGLGEIRPAFHQRAESSYSYSSSQPMLQGMERPDTPRQNS